MSVHRFPAIFLTASFLWLSSLMVGCETGEEAQQKTVDSGNVAKTQKTRKSKTQKVKPKKTMKRGSLSGGKRNTSTRVTASENQMIDKLFSVIDETVEFSDTVIVLILDTTKSNDGIRNNVQSAFLQKFRDYKSGDNELLVSVAQAGDSVKFLIDEPTYDAAKIQKAFDALKPSKSDEKTIGAVEQTYEKFKSVKKDGSELLLLLVTDEAPADYKKVDAVSVKLSKQTVPVFVIGAPAPFGRQTVVRPKGEMVVNNGPETLMPERIQLDFVSAGGNELVDSGFGPWALEKLCRKTGGAFLAIRPGGGSRFSSSFESQWPMAGIRQFEEATMRAYKPDYSKTVEQIEADIANNKAYSSLVEAAKMKRSKVLQMATQSFTTGDEARLAREISGVQRQAAIVSLSLSQLYQKLKSGEEDRDKLSSLRSKISFDLAYGRASANYVRAEGFNAMLAKLKSGMSFTDKENTTWYLKRSKSIASGSQHRRIAENATKALESIVKDHPGTPWAMLAQQELNTPMGWEWSEGK